MRLLIGFFLLFKMALFSICLIICIPIAYAFPAYFIAGITRFQYKCIDDLERCGIYTKEEAEEQRKEV